ncbi:heparinase II/III domain-containing protein [Arthrobacter sp. CG_A4]|uniref:heparinase II/III domain-containing protein n=1 Tax=Arthrobacter sp. CG_A4 TaxID=3071706 RepID=UPI002E0D7C74
MKALIMSENLITPGPHGQRPARHANTDIAQALQNGFFKLYRYDPVPYAFPIDWDANPFDNTWKWALNSFQFLYDAVHVGELRKDSSLQTLSVKLLQDWWRVETESGHSSYNWKGHTTALRAQVISYLHPLCSEDWYVAMMVRHGEELARADVYEAVHNHGLDQDLGLLAIGGALGADEWIELAKVRSGQSAAAMVDRQGVSSEQAVGYTYYVYALLGKIADALVLCGHSVPTSILNRKAVPTFLAHATQPNGEYVVLGDTPICKAYDLVDTDAEYPATQGQRGSVPQDDVRMFDNGWIFGRSGWGTQRDFENESFYSLRFGPGASVHGHADGTSLTFFSQRQPLVTEAGFGGYGDLEFYHYERSALAHNTVVVEGYGPYLTNRPTLLTSNTTAPKWARHQLVGWPYVGIKRERTVVFLKELKALVVRDRIWAANVTQFCQRWHLSPDMEIVEETPQMLAARLNNVTLSITQLLPVDSIQTQRGQKNPLSGWVATAQGTRKPTSVANFVSHGQGTDFVTLITANTSVDVRPTDHGAGWRLTVSETSKYLISLDEISGLQVVSA